MEQGRWGRVLLVALDLVLGCRLVVEGFCDMDSYFLVMFRFRVPVSPFRSLFCIQHRTASL